MPAADAALLAIARNAIRHLIEADDHFKHQRYASALASAVFSIEESGKLGFVRATGKSGKNATNHKLKQLPFLLMLKFAENFGWMAQWQRILKEGLDPIASLTEQQEKFITEHPEFSEFIKRLRDGELTKKEDRMEAFAQAQSAKEKRDGTFDRWLPLFKGELNKLRFQATYVDIDDVGEVIADPSLLTAEQAEGMCAGALILLALSIEIFLPVHLKEDFFKSFPDNFTGTRLLEDFSNGLIKLMKKAK